MSLGFGVAGALDRRIVAELGAAAELAGYATFWTNDTPNGDGLEALAVAQSATQTIRLGVGVIPVDRKPAAEIVAQVDQLDLDRDRLIVGIGSGGLRSGAVHAVRENARDLAKAGIAKVIVGALGPRMCSVGAVDADGVLLNWLTPGQLTESSSRVREQASAAGREVPFVGAYVRVALEGTAAVDRLRMEAERYERFPAYARHFARMGASALETSVVGTGETIPGRLTEFAVHADETIVRAIAAEESLEAYLALLSAALPSSS